MEKCSLYDHLKSILNSNDCEAQIGKVQYTFTKNIFAWKKNNGILNGVVKIAMSLRSARVKAYRYFHNTFKYPLPASSSLNRWVSSSF